MEDVLNGMRQQRKRSHSTILTSLLDDQQDTFTPKKNKVENNLLKQSSINSSLLDSFFDGGVECSQSTFNSPLLSAIHSEDHDLFLADAQNSGSSRSMCEKAGLAEPCATHNTTSGQTLAPDHKADSINLALRSVPCSDTEEPSGHEKTLKRFSNDLDDDVAALLGLRPTLTVNQCEINNSNVEHVGDRKEGPTVKQVLKAKYSFDDKMRACIAYKTIELLDLGALFSQKPRKVNQSIDKETNGDEDPSVVRGRILRSIWLSRCQTEEQKSIILSIIDNNDASEAIKNIPLLMQTVLSYEQARRDENYLKPLFQLVEKILRSYRHPNESSNEITEDNSRDVNTAPCLSCGSLDLELDTATMSRICCRCGAVVECDIWDALEASESHVASIQFQEGRRFLRGNEPYRGYSSADWWRRKYEAHRHLKIRGVGEKIGIKNESDLQEIDNMICRYYSPRRRRIESLLFEKVVAAACFFLLRQRGDSVTISTIATRTGLHATSLKSVVSKMAIILGIRDLPHISCKSYVDMSAEKILSTLQASESDTLVNEPEKDETFTISESFSERSSGLKPQGKGKGKQLSLEDIEMWNKNRYESLTPSDLRYNRDLLKLHDTDINASCTLLTSFPALASVISVTKQDEERTQNNGILESSSLLDELFEDEKPTNTNQSVQEIFEKDEAKQEVKASFDLSRDRLSLLNSTRFTSTTSILPASELRNALSVPQYCPSDNSIRSSSQLDGFPSLSFDFPSSEANSPQSSLLLAARIMTNPKVKGLINESKLEQIVLLSEQLIDVYLRARIRQRSVSQSNINSSIQNSSASCIGDLAAQALKPNRLTERRLKSKGIEDETNHLVKLTAAAIHFAGTYLRVPIATKKLAEVLEVNSGSLSRIKSEFIETIRLMLYDVKFLDSGLEEIQAGPRNCNKPYTSAKFIIQIVRSNYQLLKDIM